MAYRRQFRHTRPTARTITVKYDGKCTNCGCTIKAGERAEYSPPGTHGNAEGQIRHMPNVWDGGELVPNCHMSAEARALRDQRAVNDYAGDGLDARYEDDCAAICGR
jgi:hypothetical protein